MVPCCRIVPVYGHCEPDNQPCLFRMDKQRLELHANADLLHLLTSAERGLGVRNLVWSMEYGGAN